MPCFPNLHSLHIQFQSNATVFRDSLDILFDAQLRPDFKLLPRHRPQTAVCTCSQLTEFTLFKSSIEFFIYDIKFILAYMKNLIKLTLSIHDTFDLRFCYGFKFESILSGCLLHLRQFHYTMTHPIAN
ncbi:unnamed protein product [Rotaria sp. Silwood1]|nr:unnamed protein product [Rotaria sp. Silwood1]CAF1611015.1 unnamed protein product [Rotaria sp. Silwood1]CAF4805422.1 unnamed protein product [Rotaria sp. Silwood1]CAF4890262.1 unnamed protein product [Rotaria sp. Silwood1]